MRRMIASVLPLLSLVAALALAAVLFPAGSYGAPALSPAADAAAPNQSDADLRAQAGARWSDVGFRTRTVALNGTELFVAEAGTGPAVLLLHGYPQSGEAWHRVAKKLAETHHVIVPDLRGMGLSGVAAGNYDLATVAEDMHQLVQASAPGRVAVVGHDWGGSVGAVYALRYRDEVSRLAFLESALPGAGFEQLWSFTKPNPPLTFIPFLLMGEGEANEDITAVLLRGREQAFLHHLWAGFTGDKTAVPFDAWAPYVAAMRRPGLSVSGASYYRAVYRSADEVRTLVAASPLTIPVLAIGGERAIGGNQEALVRAFASNVVRSLVLPGAGHFLPEERPDAISAELSAFLE